VLTGVVTFLLLLIGLLAIPVTMTFQVSWQETLRNEIELRWMFGLVRVRVSRLRPEPPSTKEKEVRQKIPRSWRRSRRTRNILAAFRQEPFRRRIMVFISDLWRAFRKHNLKLRVLVGLGDPADTGQLWGVLGPMAGVLANVQDATIELVPEFVDTTLQLDGSGKIRIIPLHLVYLAVALLLSPPVWRGIRDMRLVSP
jgi:hypothetical protein